MNVVERVFERCRENRISRILITEELFLSVFKNRDEKIMFTVFDGIPNDSELVSVFMSEFGVEVHITSPSFDEVIKGDDIPIILPKTQRYFEGSYWEKMQHEKKKSETYQAFIHFGIAVTIGIGIAVGLSAWFHFMDWV